MSSHTQLDATGMVCPLPAAETRKALKIMQLGETLEVKGDFPQAVENIVRMAEKMKAEIIEKESAEEFYRVLIRKK